MTELRRALPFLALSLLLLVAGCSLLPGPGPSEPPVERRQLAEDLRAAEARWAAAGLSSYRFTLTYRCFCPWTDPLSVSVVDDQVTSVTMNGEHVANAAGLPLLIESAFERVRASLDAHEVEAVFNDQLGYPERVTVDPIENAIDDELAFEITDFAPGEGPPAMDPAAVELLARRDAWLRLGPTSYEWQVSFACECVLGGATTIRVEDGVAVEIQNPLVDLRPDEVAGFPLTVEALFDEALRTLASGGTVEATWDEASGLPRTLFLDRDLQAIDDELGVTVEGLAPAS